MFQRNIWIERYDNHEQIFCIVDEVLTYATLDQSFVSLERIKICASRVGERAARVFDFWENSILEQESMQNGLQIQKRRNWFVMGWLASTH